MQQVDFSDVRRIWPTPTPRAAENRLNRAIKALIFADVAALAIVAVAFAVRFL